MVLVIFHFNLKLVSSVGISKADELFEIAKAVSSERLWDP